MQTAKMDGNQKLLALRMFAPFAPHFAYGAFEVISGESFDVFWAGNPYTWTICFGIFAGYIIWDMSQPLQTSGVKSWWRRLRNKDPLALYVDIDVVEGPSGDIDAEIYAIVSNDSDRRVSAACITTEKVACDGGEVEFIEFCADIAPRESGLKVPLFDVCLQNGANIARYRISSRYLKSGHSTEWCPMTEMAFEFEPCFSSETQARDCEVHCNVVAPFSAKEPIKIFEAYGVKR